MKTQITKKRNKKKKKKKKTKEICFLRKVNRITKRHS